MYVADERLGWHCAARRAACGFRDDRPLADQAHHFWSGEGGKETADPGQDSHDAPDMSGLWVILDTTPEGRGTAWYPKLKYGAGAQLDESNFFNLNDWRIK